ncbi:hypothetical protein [Streptomyces sp. NBC_01465]|uniref:hypothetical protein n=1 Tax=Streptomyces sp. NBC_01465 TaxID=2903878 RepID=UPI002E31E520|nr:hypothetical protein [Streptomyces sp. NBC_01465]
MRHSLTRTATLTATALLLAAAPVVQASAAPTAAPRPTLSAKATVKSIAAWHQFRVYGSSGHMRAGTRVTLQQLQRKHWVSLPIHMNTTRTGAYNLRVELGLRGANKIRIVGGGAVSPTVSVTIR